MRKGRRGFVCADCRREQPTPYSNRVRAERFASLKGWKLGHVGGGAEIVCGDCAPGFYEAVPLCTDTARENRRRAKSHQRRFLAAWRARTGVRRPDLPARGGPGKRERARLRAQASARRWGKA